MKIENKAAPDLANSRVQQSAVRERAMKAFMGEAQPEQLPVQNATQVQPEELSVVKSSTQPSETIQESQPSGQSDAIETPSEPKAETKQAKDESLSPQYAILARKEKALRAKVQAQEQALRTKEAEFAAREEAIKAKEAEYQSNYVPKNKLSEDPITTLLEAGVSYDDITQRILNQSQAQVDPATKLAIQKLEAQVKAQQEMLEQSRKAQEEATKSQYQAALKQIEFDTKQLVKSDPVAYELINKTGSSKDVVELIEKTFNEDGVILTVEEAAQYVENYLVDRLSKYATATKIQRKLQPKAAPKESAPAQAQKPQQTQQSQTKTLTNAVGSTKPMSARERAIAAFNGQLKK